MRKVIDNKTYIVFDGTSHYEIMGCDFNPEEEEIVRGPFNEMNDKVVAITDQLNEECMDHYNYKY